MGEDCLSSVYVYLLSPLISTSIGTGMTIMMHNKLIV